jgi:hypothetical protein
MAGRWSQITYKYILNILYDITATACLSTKWNIKLHTSKRNILKHYICLEIKFILAYQTEKWMFPYLVTRSIFELLQSSLQSIQRFETLLVIMSNTMSGMGAVEARKFAYKLTFKQFKSIFTDCPSVFRRVERFKKYWFLFGIFPYFIQLWLSGMGWRAVAL